MIETGELFIFIFRVILKELQVTAWVLLICWKVKYKLILLQICSAIMILLNKFLELSWIAWFDMKSKIHHCMLCELVWQSA